MVTLYAFELRLVALECSEPTVWDGDQLQSIEAIRDMLVLSPPCGMVTTQSLHKCFPLLLCSEPTVWDGDSILRLKAFEINTCASSEPTVWDGDKRKASCSLTPKALCSKPTVWDGDSLISICATFSKFSFLFRAHCVGW